MELCLQFCYAYSYARYTFCSFFPIRWMMPTSGIVPIPCVDAAEGMVQLPVNSKRPSKLSGALARQAARRRVLEHVALGHGSRVVQRKSSPLVGLTLLPVASLLSTASTSASSPMATDAVDRCKRPTKVINPIQADRGCAAVASFFGGKGAFGQKRMLRSAGYGFPRRKKSSASRQYCKCINRQ